METNKFEQLKNIAQKTSLTAGEKTVLRSNIESFMKFHPVIETGARTARVKSPFSPFMIFARSVAFVLIGMLAGGSGLAYASEQALPGDVLYPVKINVTEEVVSAFSFTPEAKLEWETKRILRRVDEIQKIEEVKNTQPISVDDTKLALESLDASLTKFEENASTLREQNKLAPVLTATAKIDNAFNGGDFDKNEQPIDETQIQVRATGERTEISKDSVITRAKNIVTSSDTQSIESISNNSVGLEDVVKKLLNQLIKEADKIESENSSIDFTKINEQIVSIEQKINDSNLKEALKDIQQTRKDITGMIKFANQEQKQSIDDTNEKSTQEEPISELIETNTTRIQGGSNEINLQ